MGRKTTTDGLEARRLGLVSGNLLPFKILGRACSKSDCDQPGLNKVTGQAIPNTGAIQLKTGVLRVPKGGAYFHPHGAEPVSMYFPGRLGTSMVGFTLPWVKRLRPLPSYRDGFFELGVGPRENDNAGCGTP